MIDVKKLNLKITRLVDSLFIGNYKTAFKGKGLEFSDYRQYDYSSDAKYIDFLASKREGKLLIKRFEEERELNVFFLLDLSNSMNFGIKKSKLDTMAEIFYTISLSAILNNDKVGSVLFNEDGFSLIKPSKGRNSVLKILKKIENKDIKKINDFNINKLFSFFNSIPVKNSLVFLITDKIGEIDDKYLKIQSIKNDFVYINVFDYVENNLFDDNNILKVGFLDKIFFLNFRDKEKVEEYRALRKNKITNFKNKLSNYKISYLLFDDKTNIFKNLLKFFKSR